MPTEQEKLDFSNIVATLAKEKNITYFEAVILHCENTELEEHVAATLLTKSIIAKISQEVNALNLFKKKISGLPI